MSDPLGSWIDPVTGAVILPLWAAGAFAALIVVFCVVAFSRAGYEGLAGNVGRIALVLVGAVFAWLFLQGSAKQNMAAERRALEARAGALAARATMPGSPLACLDALAGDTVEQSCERVLFATPEAMASAVSYVAAQLGLFVEVSAFAKRGNAEIGPLLANLRRAIEADRYGLVAHVLATRDGCTAEQCPALAMMRDPARLSANLTQRTYDSYVTVHSSVWPAPASTPTADAAQGTAAIASPAAPRPAGTSGDLFFPSSESIPPVNIMTAEPPAPSETTGSAPARAAPRRPAQKDQQQKSAPKDLNAAARGAPPAQ